jgi:hypothetical protein
MHCPSGLFEVEDMSCKSFQTFQGKQGCTILPAVNGPSKLPYRGAGDYINIAIEIEEIQG